MNRGFRLAHFSDPHLTRPLPARWHQLANKRLLGFLSWHFKRRHEHRPEVLAALIDDLKHQNPDHIVITGDLTQTGLPGECRQAAAWLDELGDPETITVIPGNHDRYVADPWKETLGLWQPYYHSEHTRGFPLLRHRGPLALIGLDSAPPTAPFLATGRLGEAQYRRLEPLLTENADHCRIVLIHHPPHPEAVKARKRLTDTERLIQLLRQHGCGLVLHGHSHQWQLHWLEGPQTPIPVIGVPSASAQGYRRGYRARYHLYHIRRQGHGWWIEVEIRGLDPVNGTFRHEGRLQLQVAG